MSAIAPCKIFFTRNVPYALEQLRQRLAEAGVNSVLVETFPSEVSPISREDLLKKVKGCTGLFCLLTDKVDDKVLDAAGPSLRVVSTMSVGYDHIDVEACKARNVRVGYTPEVLSNTTAETAVALTFAAKRRLFQCATSAKNGEWGPWQPFQYCGFDITGSTVGIIGLGRIGTSYARMLMNGFNCSILYTGPRPKPDVARSLGGEEGSVKFVDMETLLRRSDIVSLHQPLTEATRCSFSKNELKLMKSTAVLINTGRGGLVDQEALVEALQQKTIAAAGLDVTTPEPLSPTHPLLSLDNCIVMPHIGSATFKTRQAMADIAVANLVAGVLDNKLPNEIK
ncbi:glyoxylate reductase hydroxypyruvate [Plasmopara halstedii]|uniref:Glyoxylate reductase hydroxypyruvate n=1 Tax=Plasmopara halstedii TaxID=4781 RepID=A0A0P1AA41_PLAHL|nr:glyoxylate reductase hydroxypyruvate [Plasmopara halstedii]CEG37153.1 glyoxylate reductase hydroxypyruvate [Plasmopara halstedii]|eukprot:XP_024573522.1 glyoxylate reductase hydroxypyruvate [Plasmopara halstedii]